MYLLIYYIYLFCSMIEFSDLNMHKNSQKFAHVSELVKIYI